MIEFNEFAYDIIFIYRAIPSKSVSTALPSLILEKKKKGFVLLKTFMSIHSSIQEHILQQGVNWTPFPLDSSSKGNSLYR